MDNDHLTLPNTARFQDSREAFERQNERLGKIYNERMESEGAKAIEELFHRKNIEYLAKSEAVPISEIENRMFVSDINAHLQSNSKDVMAIVARGKEKAEEARIKKEMRMKKRAPTLERRAQRRRDKAQEERLSTKMARTLQEKDTVEAEYDEAKRRFDEVRHRKIDIEERMMVASINAHISANNRDVMAIMAKARAPAPAKKKPERILNDQAVVAIARKKEYTFEQLLDFNEITLEGDELGVNIRGDLIDGDYNFEGHYGNGKWIKNVKPPADWDRLHKFMTSGEYEKEIAKAKMVERVKSMFETVKEMKKASRASRRK